MRRGQPLSVRFVRTFCAVAAGVAFAAQPVAVLAGPPFQTDDPEPVDLGHYEFYVFAASDSTHTENGSYRPGASSSTGARCRIRSCTPS